MTSVALTKEQLLETVKSLSPEIKVQEKADRAAVIIPLGEWLKLAGELRNDSRLQLDMLCDYAAIDWPTEQLIELDLQVYSTVLKHYLLVSVQVPRLNPVAPSVASVWPIAEWQEREIYDLFGVKFANHPDLRRIFLEDDWVGHPLLKDYKDDFMLERPW